MRTRTLLIAVAASLFVSAGAAADDKSAEEKVKEYLGKINGAERGVLTHIKDEPAKAFPKFSFASLVFRQFPVARQVPEPLKENNILVVPSGDARIALIGDIKQLEKFFKEHAAKETDFKQGRNPPILHAWLRLAQELSQDGFYKFKAPSGIVVSDMPSGTDKLSIYKGKVEVEQAGGNKGDISVTMEFKNGVLEKIEHKNNLMPGPRPICQATKLLDTDPIVRRMAEDSIRVMGKACKFYLDEQRGKASPELQRAIDRVWQRIVDEDR